LADALRTYLDGYAIDVRTAPVSNTDDLREQLASADAVGAQVQALATLRVSADSTTVEIQLVDRLTRKALVARVARAERDADFYRSVALKVQALLRSTLYEEPEKVAAVAPALSPLILARAPSPRRNRLSLEVSYALQSFPLGRLVQQGVAVRARIELARIFELALGIDGLVPARAERDDVTAQLYTVPVMLAADVHLRRSRVEGAMGAVAQINVLRLDASSSNVDVRSETTVVPAFGVEAAGRVRLGSVLWLYARAAVLGAAVGKRFTIDGTSVFDVSGLQVSANLGLGAALW
jgi:hypothetical protein